MTQETVTNGTEALFTREGMPPVKEMIPCALQHVLASFAGIITPAVIMAGVYGFNSQQSTDIIQVALILSAIDTALQAFAPSVASAAACPSSWAFRSRSCRPCRPWVPRALAFGALLGGEIVGGAVAVLFGLAYSKIKWLFPPVVTGTVIFSIGVSLYPTAVKYMAGGMGTPLWGTPQAWCVALITFAVVFALANFGKGTLKLGSVFFGMIVGMIVSIPFGMIDFSSVATAQVFALPKLMPYALEFDPEVCITLAVVFPMVAIQVIGDVSAACLGSIDRMPTERELSGAIVSQGLTSMVGGLLGGLPTSALGQNVGIICSNKVVNKWVFVIIAAVFAIAGLFPQLSAVLSAIPQPVIGGATVGVFGTITMNGVRMFTREGLTQRTTTIVGTSVVFGLGIWMASGCLAGEGMPAWVSTVIGSNAVTPTAIMAIVLNLILPQTPVVAQHIDAAKDAAVDLVLPESKK